MIPPIAWWIFGGVVLSLLALDLFAFNRKAHEVKIKEALFMAAFWIGLALLFNVGVYHWFGHKKALEFLTGYLIEESLSIDNLFVFIMVFTYFRVEARYQHRILFWGILGAIIMRAIFIFAGVALIERFHWIIYLFGGFLIYTGIKMATQGETNVDPEKNPVVRFTRKFIPIHAGSDHEGRMFIKKDGKNFATVLFLVLLVVESTDLIFALDSIPAVLAISQDPFIVYTSNIFAILGLRALYFALSGAMSMFHFLKYGLSVILIFVGGKMIVSNFYPVPIVVALGIVGGVLATSVVLSLLFPEKKSAQNG